jgi:hypothetical protein
VIRSKAATSGEVATVTEDADLPESDDPFEVLGLELNADERAVKRAYARLARRFKPERDPSSFQRLREAYEGALEHLRWQAEMHAETEASAEAPLGDTEIDEEWLEAKGATDDGAREPAESTDARESTASTIWRTLVETERYDEAIQALEEARQREPRAAWTYVERYALEARRGGDVELAHEALAQGILADAPVMPFIFQRVAPPERAYLANHAALPWSALRELSDREHVCYLFQERIESLLIAANLETAQREVNAEDFRRDAEDNPHLRRIAQQVAAAAQWLAPDTAEGTGGWAFDDEFADYFERIYLEKGFRREDWKDRVFPEALDRFIAVYDTLSPNGTKMAAMELLDEIEAQPSHFASSFFQLALESSRAPLLDDMIDGLSNLIPDGEGLALNEDRDARLREVVAEESWLESLPEDRGALPDIKLPAAFWVGVVFILAPLAILMAALLTGLDLSVSSPGLLALIGFVLARHGFQERRTKVRALRERRDDAWAYAESFAIAAELAINTGLSVASLGAWIREHRADLAAELPSRLDHVERSRPLELIVRLVAVRRTVQGDEEE